MDDLGVPLFSETPISITIDPYNKNITTPHNPAPQPRHKASAVKPVMAGKSKPAPFRTERATVWKGGEQAKILRGQQLFRGGKKHTKSESSAILRETK